MKPLFPPSPGRLVSISFAANVGFSFIAQALSGEICLSKWNAGLPLECKIVPWFLFMRFSIAHQYTLFFLYNFADNYVPFAIILALRWICFEIQSTQLRPRLNAVLQPALITLIPEESHIYSLRLSYKNHRDGHLNNKQAYQSVICRMFQ